MILSTTPLLQFLDDYLRHSSSQSTSAHSALGAVFGVDALYKLTFYLLTYFTKLATGLPRILLEATGRAGGGRVISLFKTAVILCKTTLTSIPRQ